MSEDIKAPAATANEPTADEPTADEPTADEPTASEPTADEPTASEPTANEPEAAADEPKNSVEQGEDDGAVLDAAGRERPRFLLGFPPHPELARLSAAFEAGNYALVRAEAEGLAERAENRAVRDAALELRRRIEPDPLVKYLLALTAALLLSLAYWAYHH